MKSAKLLTLPKFLNEQKQIITQAKKNIKLLNEFSKEIIKEEIINKIKSELNFIRTVIIRAIKSFNDLSN